jgi:hypothetical protein
MALAGIHVRVSIDVFALTVNYSLSPVVLVAFEWIARSKSVSLDGRRLLLAVADEESNSRFVGRFHWHNVSLTTTAINKCEHRWLVLGIASTTTVRHGEFSVRLVDTRIEP